MQLEREVEQEYRPQMLAALQRKVDAVAEEAGSRAPACPQCGQPMGHHDTRSASWRAQWGRLRVLAPRYLAGALGTFTGLRASLPLLGL